MERSSIEEKETEDKLQLQYKHLQQDWESYKQSIPKTSSTDTKTMAKTLQLLDNSPRSLMNSLQDRGSPSEGVWKVRSIDLAVEEIRRERRAAIESGKLKGRRLFAAVEAATEVGSGGREEICSGLSDLVQESESMFSYGSDDENEYGDGNEEEKFPICYHPFSCSSSSSSSPLSGEKVEREEAVGEGEWVVASVEEKRVVEGVDGNGGTGMFFVGWLGISLMAFVLGIISLRSFGAYGDEGEVILVPT